MQLQAAVQAPLEVDSEALRQAWLMLIALGDAGAAAAAHEQQLLAPRLPGSWRIQQQQQLRPQAHLQDGL